MKICKLVRAKYYEGNVFERVRVDVDKKMRKQISNDIFNRVHVNVTYPLYEVIYFSVVLPQLHEII